MKLNKVIQILGEYTDLSKQKENIDSLANMAQRQYFLSIVEDNDAKIDPFRIDMGGDSDTMPMVVSVNGTALIPADFYKYESSTFLYVKDGVRDIVQIQRLEKEEFDHRKGHPIEMPTLKYPICSFSDKYIRFLPKNIQYVNFSYIQYPPDIHYATKLLRGWDEYDPANSIEFKWKDPDVINIIQIILNELGIKITPNQIKAKQ